MMIKIKRIYEKPEKEDGFRILVDRLWPRGISKEKAKIDLWLKEIAPSQDLRKWFGHDLKKCPEFKKKYIRELSLKEGLLNRIPSKKTSTTTLLFAAKEQGCNNAAVLKNYLEKKLTK